VWEERQGLGRGGAVSGYLGALLHRTLQYMGILQLAHRGGVAMGSM
jgi:hypothetical protein